MFFLQEIEEHPKGRESFEYDTFESAVNDLRELRQEYAAHKRQHEFQPLLQAELKSLEGPEKLKPESLQNVAINVRLEKMRDDEDKLQYFAHDLKNDIANGTLPGKLNEMSVTLSSELDKYEQADQLALFREIYQNPDINTDNVSEAQGLLERLQRVREDRGF